MDPALGQIVASVMSTAVTAKMVHWNTKSFALHDNTNEFFSSLLDALDTLVEAMLSKNPEGLSMVPENLVRVQGTNLQGLLSVLTATESVLASLETTPWGSFTEILNLRDTLLESIDKFKYKLRFS